MTRIYLDAMGGDNAPKCTAEGAIEALRADSDLRITLGGDAAQLTPLLMDCDDVRERITVEHTTQVITNHDSPVMAVRTMKDSSIVRGMKAEQVIERFEGVKCGFRNTSCPDQIAKNLKKALAEMD